MNQATENKLINLGKISQFIAKFFRYAFTIIIWFSIPFDAKFSDMESYIWKILGLILGAVFIYMIFPLKTSIYNDFFEFIQQKKDIKNFKKQFIIKLLYNIILFSIILFAVNIIVDEWFTYNIRNKILLSVIPGILICLLLFQFYYFYIVYGFVKINKEKFSENLLLVNENIIEKNKEKITLDNLENKVKNNTTKALQFINNKFKDSKWINSLNHNEIIVVSVIIGVIVFLVMGYVFGTNHSYTNSYQTGYSRSGRANFSTNTINQFNFNYVLAISGFILSSGISYLVLNSKRK